jgi:guanylate kinase
MKKIIIVAPGASGKDYLLKYLKEQGYKVGLSCTTRPPRPEEVDGVDYHFITQEKFSEMIYNCEFLEYNMFKTWMYGNTFENFVENEVFVMTPNVLNVLRRDEVYIIYLNIDEEVRRERLHRRKDKNDAVERRLKTDREDFKDFKNFDLEVIEPNFDPKTIIEKIKNDQN